MKTKLFFLIVFFYIVHVNAQVAINMDNSSPDASAMLDIKSTNSGLLIPRMSSTDRDNISSPATGLTVYVTNDNNFYYYNGSTWIPLQQSGKAWLLAGNTGTDASQFIGTTDGQPLIIKTNNAERVRIKDNGVIGINVAPDDNYLLYAESNSHDVVGRFINTRQNYDGYGVYATSSSTDYYGYGGYFRGGYIGAFAEVLPTGSDYYYGTVINASGGDGTNMGLLSVSTGTGDNYGVYSYVSGGATNYAYYASSDIANDYGAVAFLANSNDTGTAIIALGSNVTNYNYSTDGQALAATGKIYTITAYSEEDDSDAIMVLGQYEGNGNTVDATGIEGYSVPSDNWGYGVKGFGGWIGVYGGAQNGLAGVYGDDSGTSSYGVYSNGELGASGTKSFAIDHPLDPGNKILKHFSIESNEVLNVYRGNVVLDAQGKALIQLPSYFHAVNKNFSYNLTPLGSAAPNLFVETEINEDGSFAIAGGQPGQKVSWYVYAERNDPYLQQYPEKRRVEVMKNEKQRGKYLRPELYGQSADKGINFQKKSRVRVTKTKKTQVVSPKVKMPLGLNKNK